MPTKLPLPVPPPPSPWQSAFCLRVCLGGSVRWKRAVCDLSAGLLRSAWRF